jgi:hypothetical protein
MFSNEIRQALELITGARLRSVYIVWTDLFIVLERMKRRRVMRKALAEMGFFGEVPKMSDLSQDTDVEIDNTIHRSFYLTISDSHIYVVDIKMGGLIETISLYDIIEVVILLSLQNTPATMNPMDQDTLFSIAFHGTEDDPADQGHALLKCFRRRELMAKGLA